MNPYLNFAGRAAEAMAFYQSLFGGDLASNRYADFGMNEDPADADRIMHSQLETAEGWILMGADLPSSAEVPGDSPVWVSLSAGADEADKLGNWFTQLSEGGHVHEPLAQAPWGDHFGAVADRFGTRWMFNIGGSPA